MSFNWLVYKHLNPDLKLSTSQQYEKHYLENGKKEGRKKSVYDLYPDFNPMIYRNNYSNLENLTVFELELHWLVTGVKEERSYYNILSIINGMSLIITEEAEEIKNTNEYDNIIKELNLDNVENEVECENKENKENEKIKEDKHLDKKILVVVNNNYDLDFVEVEKYLYIVTEILKTIAYVVDEEDSKGMISNKYIEYIINLSAGDLITQKYVEENIKYMEKNITEILKPNSFCYLGENQVYQITTKNFQTYIESGIIYKKDADILNSQYTNNINTEIITKYLKSESDLLNDGIYDYEISDNNMVKSMCKETNTHKIIQILTGTKNKLGYVTLLDMNRLTNDYMLRLQLYVTKLLQYDFDIIEINDVSKYNLESYNAILLDGNLFNKNSSKIQIGKLCNSLSVLEMCKNNYIITHDLHDWSFGFSSKPQEYIGSVSYPCMKMTAEKNKLKKLLQTLNVKSVISIYDCPEFDFMKESFTDTIDRFYTLHHFISTPIYHLPKVITKNIDILFYGINDPTYYLFRHRLLNITKDHFNTTQINRKFEFDADICEQGLADHISKSWITLSCISNFSYAVRKFNEITECGSTVLGNTNNQIDHILGEGMLRVDEKMSDNEIVSLIRKHLEKKNLLVYLGFKARKKSEKFNDNNYILNLRNIIEYGNDISYPEIKIVQKKLNKSFRKKINNNSFTLDQLGDILIEIDLINNNILDNRISCLINTDYYRSVIINDNYYIYIDDNKGSVDIKLLTDQNISTVIFYIFQN